MDQSEVTLERLRSFVRVVERGSFSAVARELETAQSTVTRQVRDLEAALGVQLFARTTRRVVPTDEGWRLHARAVHILQMVEQSCQELGARHGAMTGTVRVSCTAALGVLHVARLLFAFQDAHPGIAVDLRLTDERVDLVREGMDLALRLGPLSDSALRLRALGASRRLLVAAPAYLARRGVPDTPAALSTHEGIRMSNVSGSDVLHLVAADGRTERVPFGGRLRVDHGLAAREALLAGRGIAPAHRWLVDDLLADGRLVQVLPDYAPEPVPFSLLIVPQRAAVPRVRALVDFLVAQAGTIPGLGEGQGGRTRAV